MDDMLKTSVTDLCRHMEVHGALDVVGLGLGSNCSWASCLVIGTVTSGVHMNGLAIAVRDRLRSDGREPKSGAGRTEDVSWRMIDGGDIVVSLMDRRSREFYALEERWYESEVLFRSDEKRSTIVT